MNEQSAALLEQIRSGQNRQLQLLAASGLVPLAPDELLPIQIALAHSPDAEVSSRARQALDNLNPGPVRDYLDRQANERELGYFAQYGNQPEILEIVLRRRDLPHALLETLAPRLPEALQEVLVLRQDAIVEHPAILTALESNPRLSTYAQRRVWEYREHLLPRDKVPPKSAAEIEAEADQLSEGAVLEAIEEARGVQVTETVEVPADTVDEEGVEDLTAGLSEGQIRTLPLPVRIRLARTAGRNLRWVLVRDQSVQVAVSVLSSNRMTDQEVEQYANSKSVQQEVLTEIGKRREWMRRYGVVKALARNPKTAPPMAMRLVSRLAVWDLRDISRDKNVPHAVRSMAMRLYQKKR